MDDVFRPQLMRAVQRALRAAGAASAVSSVAAAGLDPEERAARGGAGGADGGGAGATPAKERNDKVGGLLERLAWGLLAPVSPVWSGHSAVQCGRREKRAAAGRLG